MGELEAARNSLEGALDVQEAALGPDHPDTLHALSRLARILADMGEFSLAREFAERALTGQRRILGDDHSDTQSSQDLLDYIGGL
jgi:tetratricopeptide (TPR) repeat protein